MGCPRGNSHSPYDTRKHRKSTDFQAVQLMRLCDGSVFLFFEEGACLAKVSLFGWWVVLHVDRIELSTSPLDDVFCFLCSG